MSQSSFFQLIVTDMDGTLLDAVHQLPPEFKEVVTALRQRGIRWAIASGRQLANLKKRFDELDVAVDLIAENGALAQCAGESAPFFRNLTSVRVFRDILHAALTLPGATPVLCGDTCAYVHDAHPEHFAEVARYFEAITYWHEIEAVESYSICKLAIFHPDAAGVLYPALSSFETDDLRVILSGANWVDVQAASIDKSAALQALMQRFSYTPAQVIAFGDYFNDVGMLTCGVHGVAMANALPEIRALTPHHAPKNTQNGVMTYLRKLGVIDSVEA